MKAIPMLIIYIIMGFAMYYMEDIVNYAKEYKNSQNEKTFVISAKDQQKVQKR